MKVILKLLENESFKDSIIFVKKDEGFFQNLIALIMLPTCSYGLKNSEDIEINYLFHFNVLDTFYTSCLRVFKRRY